MCGRYRESHGLRPFPTIYWMTCPIMQARVSELEKSGWITTLENRLLQSRNDEYVNAMINSHQRYINERWNLLTECDKEYVEKKGW